jgi:putative oxidoreductase
MKSQINAFLTNVQQTQANHTAAAIRILMGVLFLMTGVMKFVFPELRTAFSGQLNAAAIPFHDLNMWLVPAVEIAIGALLLVGVFTRLATLVVFGLMAVATYVHLVVHDPALFPLQPTQPIIPAIVMLLGLYLLWRGGGAWSLDLRSQAAEAAAAPMRPTAAGTASRA